MTYYIITYGCQMNKSDSERIANELEKDGYQRASKIEEANLVVINVCSVRQSAVDRVYSKIKNLARFKIQNSKFKIILTGCILEKDKKQLKEQVDEIWPIIDPSKKPNHQSSCEAFVPIMTGCDNFCAYCVVPYTRGREYSRPAQEIIKEVKDLVRKEYKEITLLGQNVNSYRDVILEEGAKRRPIESRKKSTGFYRSPDGSLQNDITIDFPEFLKMICQIPGDFQIKFLTSHPKDMSDELIKTIAQGEKISKEIHLPVQSGDDEILKKMNRGYTVQDYKKLIKKIRQRIPKAKISTDIIVGFPGETKKQFQNTVDLVKEIGFCQIYAAAYSVRANTPAAKLKDNVLNWEKKRRKKVILGMLDHYPKGCLKDRLSPVIQKARFG